MKKSQLLRKGRVSLANHYYNVTLVTYGRKCLFTDLYLNRLLINEMRALEEQGESKTIAFVFMPDHIHWLFQLKTSSTLSCLIRTFKGRCAKQAREQFLIPKLWQPDFYDHLIRDKSDLTNCARYIVANPLRASLVKSVAFYPHWDCIYIT
ncbi:transposase [Pseudoalteromonas nigrifaciens]|uniref:REP-associated tyrosine transposase n=1 Tax=Pseudoalteromonas TaxID=53246 RepID=UPI0030CA348A